MPYTTFKYVYPTLRLKMEELSGQQHLYSKPLSCDVIDGGILYSALAIGEIIAGGIKSKDGNIVKGTGLNSFMEVLYDTDENEIDYLDEDVVYVGFLISCYGHVITDCIKHAWFVNSNQYQAHKHKKMIYTVCGQVQPWHKEIFSLAGIDLDKCCLISKPTRFRSVVVPQPSFIDMNEYSKPTDSFYANPFYTKEYLDTIDHMVVEAQKRVQVKQVEKIFFSRKSKDKERRIRIEQYGENHVCKVVQKAGFTIIRPQDYTVAEQIALLHSCNVFMTTDGSIAHNAVFLKNAAQIVILRKILWVNAYSNTIVEARNLEACIIDCSLSILNRNDEIFFGPFFIYANNYLCEYLGVKSPIFPFRRFKKYLKSICEYNDMQERLFIDEEYRRILSTEIKNAKARVLDFLNKYIPFSDRKYGKKVIKLLYRILLYKIII